MRPRPALAPTSALHDAPATRRPGLDARAHFAVLACVACLPAPSACLDGAVLTVDPPLLADAFDAMTSTRSYRKALSQSVAVSELRDKAGSQFHPSCVDALVAALERRGEVYGAGHEEDAEHFDQPPPAAGLGSAGLGDLVPDPRDRST